MLQVCGERMRGCEGDGNAGVEAGACVVAVIEGY